MSREVAPEPPGRGSGVLALRRSGLLLPGCVFRVITSPEGRGRRVAGGVGVPPKGPRPRRCRSWSLSRSEPMTTRAQLSRDTRTALRPGL